MSNRPGAAARALDLSIDRDGVSADAVRLSGDALARVSGSELEDRAAASNLAAQDVSSGFDLAAASGGDMIMRCGCPGCMKAARAEADGPDQAKPGDPGIFLLDDIGDDTSTEASLNVQEGQSVHSQMDHPGDNDYFRVTFSAGETYEINVTPDDTSATGPDLLFEIYDANGDLVQSFDGGSFGADEEFDFTATDDGIYYINVAGYNDAAVGGYTITAGIDDDPADPNRGTPLDAIDWGTRVNTDGVTNNDGDDVIHIYFAKGPNSDPPAPPEITPHPITETNANDGWREYEKDAALNAFSQYESIINVEFVEVDSQAEADFILGASAGVRNLLGAMSPPGEATEGAAWFNNQGVGWNEAQLQQGGFGFITLIHEFGHGMGMAHPHDNGGNSTVMNGVTGSLATGYTTGDFGLNDAAYSVMSYNEAWQEHPNGVRPSSSDYGFTGTPMAFDVAVMQQKYGANMDYKTGNDTYTLFSENASGTMYACLWDAGGIDTIAAGDAMNVNIDLREATLKYEIGGGGWVSYAESIFGGYTVANGVRIENAEGGAGTDTLIGNDYRNELDGGAGRDILFGRGGNDVLTGGAERDFLRGGRGDDRFQDGAGKDVLFGGKGADKFYFETIQRDRIRDLDDADEVNLNRIDANTNRGGNQDFDFVTEFSGAAGEALLFYNSDRGITRLQLDTDGDGLANMVLELKGDQTGFDGFVG